MVAIRSSKALRCSGTGSLGYFLPVYPGFHLPSFFLLPCACAIDSVDIFYHSPLIAQFLIKHLTGCSCMFRPTCGRRSTVPQRRRQDGRQFRLHRGRPPGVAEIAHPPMRQNKAAPSICPSSPQSPPILLLPAFCSCQPKISRWPGANWREKLAAAVIQLNAARY